jgi:DNA repair exonuclease SbcCD nuclease subunit
MSDSIRIAHFSDTHLGYRAYNKVEPDSGRNQRTVDVDNAYAKVIDDILDRKVDAVIHGGDVFHHSRPTWQSLRHFIRQMRRLEQAEIPTLVIAGNHDTPRIRTGGSAFSVLELALPDIHFVCDYEDVHDLSTFAAANLHVQAIPHGSLTNPDPVFPRAVNGKRNVLVTHGLATGILAPGLQSEPGEQELDSYLFDPGFDYIALGHIHQAQQARENAWYSGSIERFGWGDAHAEPGYNLAVLTNPGTPPTVTHVTIPARPMIALKPVYGEGKQAREVADAVLDQLKSIDDDTAMTRVEFRNVDRPTRRQAQSLLKREADRFTWRLDIAPERAMFLVDGGADALDDSSLDLQTLFTEFVASRTGTYSNNAFATMLLERGGKALADALVEEESVMPEDDTLA